MDSQSMYPSFTGISASDGMVMVECSCTSATGQVTVPFWMGAGCVNFLRFFYAPAFFVDAVHRKCIRIIQNDEIGEFPWIEGAAVKEAHALGRTVGSAVDRLFRGIAHGDGNADDFVQMAFFKKCVGHGVVGDEGHPVFEAVLVDVGEEIWMKGFFLELDEDAGGEALAHTFHLLLGVVGCDAPGDSGGKFPAGDARAVAFDGKKRRLFMHGINDLVHLAVGFIDDVVHIHYFPKADGFRPCEHGLDVRDADLSAGRFQFRTGGRDGARHGKTDIEGAGTGGLHGFFDAPEPENIGNFMGLRNDGGHAVGKNSVRKGVGRHHRTLDVHMAVDESGNDIFPRNILHFSGSNPFYFISHIDNAPVPDSESGREKPFQIDIEYLAAGKKQINMLVHKTSLLKLGIRKEKLGTRS